MSNPFTIAKAYSPSITSATFKQVPSDFIVTEHLGFAATGEGEHLLVYVEKTNANTSYIAGQLAKWADIPERDVGFCGLKDRFAITQQWFSLRLPKKTAPTAAFSHSEAKILQQAWHNKKLNRGAHQSNHFCIRLTHVVGEATAIEQQLAIIAKQGVPNYFGQQRFGKNGQNITKALTMFAGKRIKRQQQGMLLSAARAYIFNEILTARVTDSTWNTALLGDVFNLAGTGSVFVANIIDDTITQRLKQGDIHPTAALWGKGDLLSFADVADLETRISQHSEQNQNLCQGLEKMGLKQERRALRLIPDALTWQFDSDNSLTLQFSLGKGCYATTVLECLVAELQQANAQSIHP